MIIVLSDLHFAEAQSTQVGSLRFNRNIPADVFEAYFAEVNTFAKANGVKYIDLVLAGDIFEISRSALWLDGEERPYIDNNDVTVGSPAEKVILQVLDAIAIEEHVEETLALFRNIKKDFDMPVHVEYILGNHDRLVNATPEIRKRVRELLGLPGADDLFKHHLILPDMDGQPFCLIRHGHEYDPTNISLRTDRLAVIPTEFPEEAYQATCLGDITSVEFGAALPYLFLKEYGEEAILHNKKLNTLYRRLVDFDDVRPNTALLSFLFSTPGVKKRKTWDLMKPCFEHIIRDLGRNKRFRQEIKKSAVLAGWKKVLLFGLLDLGIFDLLGTYWVVKRLMKMVSKQIKLDSQVKWAEKEELIQDRESTLKCVVSGHTHTPEVALISVKQGEERYYLNTGTWRNVIPATTDYLEFGHLKSTAKIFIFRPNEKNGNGNGNGWSFHFISAESFGKYRYL
jgi:UDP-2,3-diacylglucosamine pyrophosphatase LpxH